MENNLVNTLLSAKILPVPVKCFGVLDLQKIATTICAFLNGEGGWIVVGVDERQKPIDINIEEGIRQIQYELTHNIIPLPLVYVQEDGFEGKKVILLTVTKGSLAPYSYKGKYYVRIGDSIKIPSSDQISQLLRKSFSIKSSWELDVNLLADVNTLDNTWMEKVYRNGLDSHRLVESKDGLLSTLSELQMIESYEVKNGAVCLFGYDTRKNLPQSKVRIQLMSKGKTSDRFDNTRIFQGNLLYLLEEVINYLTQLLPRQSIFLKDGPLRVDEYIYPLDVLREAVGNSLIHRDYSGSAGEVSIFIYPDRMEITNPGSLPEHLIKRKNEVLPHGSILRNPLMAEFFYIAGYMEKTGRGMALISKKMQELGKKLPEWVSVNNSTTLTIFNKAEEVSLNDRIMAFLQSHPLNHIFTKNEYIDSFEKKPSKITAQNDIAKMISLGMCLKSGNGPSTKYEIIDRY